MIVREKTLITGFYGHPETWGATLQTIPGRFTCMTTFSHWIAVSGPDVIVRIYHAVTGALRLSLGPMDAVKAVRGSPNGSTLFCAHEGNSITLWDIQTGGLIRAFTLTEGIRRFEVSLKGHYLACGFPSKPIKVLKVRSRVGGVTIRDFSPNTTMFCWLEPEEQLAIKDGESVQTWDVVAGRIVRSFRIIDHQERYGSEQRRIAARRREEISGMAYSRVLGRLVVLTESGPGGIVTVIDPRAATFFASFRVQDHITCFALSRKTEELVYGGRFAGLRVFNLVTQCWRSPEHPRAVEHISPLPNGTVAVCSSDSGVQLLSLDDRSAPFSRSTLAHSMSTFDQDRIIAFCPPSRDDIQFLETSTMSKLTTISAPDDSTIPLTTVLCASLRNRMVVCYPQRQGIQRLQLYGFGDELPRWTAGTSGCPSACGISPDGTQIVTFHDARDATRICMWDAEDGQRRAGLLVDTFNSSPPHITFDSETQFYSHHNDYRVPYELARDYEASTTAYKITRHKRQPWTVELSKRQYEVGSSREWVVSDSKRICWIPPGYIGSTEGDYCWAGSETLVMVGQDKVLRTLNFRS